MINLIRYEVILYVVFGFAAVHMIGSTSPTVADFYAALYDEIEQKSDEGHLIDQETLGKALLISFFSCVETDRK